MFRVTAQSGHLLGVSVMTSAGPVALDENGCAEVTPEQASVLAQLAEFAVEEIEDPAEPEGQGEETPPADTPAEGQGEETPPADTPAEGQVVVAVQQVDGTEDAGFAIGGRAVADSEQATPPAEDPPADPPTNKKRK